MKATVNTKDMLDFLKEQWTYTHELIEDFGQKDERAQMHIGWCIGMKEMCEALLCVPVNLQRDGKLTLGIDGEVEV